MTRILIDSSLAVWRKSSHSDGGDNNCVEIAEGFPAHVPVRDSKVPDGNVLVVGRDAWAAFVGGVGGVRKP